MPMRKFGPENSNSENSAKRLCEHLTSSLASLEQVEKAHDKGLETCRFLHAAEHNQITFKHTGSILP